MRLHIDKKVLLRDHLKIGTIIRKIGDKYLVTYYDTQNRLTYNLITEDDVISEEEYKIIRNRVNTINRIIG